MLGSLWSHVLLLVSIGLFLLTRQSLALCLLTHTRLLWTCSCTHTLLNFDLVFLLFSSPLSLQYVIMGKKLAKLFGKKDMRILMLGLDAAGKTSRFYP